MKKSLLLLALLLTGCEDSTKILCENPIYTTGTLKITNRQCLTVGTKDHTKQIAFLEIENTRTHQNYIYTMDVIDDHIVLNLNNTEMLSIKSAQDAQNTANMAVVNSIALSSSSSRGD